MKHVRHRATPYSIYDPQKHEWSPTKILEIPDLPRFKNAGAGYVQRFGLPNGECIFERSLNSFNERGGLCSRYYGVLPNDIP